LGTSLQLRHAAQRRQCFCKAQRVYTKFGRARELRRDLAERPERGLIQASMTVA
jgi:hypothetical protein